MTLSHSSLLDDRVRAGEGVPLALGVGREPVCLCIIVSVHVCVCVCACVLGRERWSGMHLILGFLREGGSQHRWPNFLDQKPTRISPTTCCPEHMAVTCVVDKEQDLLFGWEQDGGCVESRPAPWAR